jgi:mannose-1-phosphate guanylyltransferase/mannose-6-phosphate isomerase
VVVRGEAKVTVGSDERIVKEGGHVFIAKGDVHRLENPKEQKLIVIEVQLGEYLREDDIERLSDDFGRA